jgi:ribosomal protein L11 methylase PrmA
MTGAPDLRAFEITGQAAAEALDWLHVHADVQGAIEGDDRVTVWLAGELPALPFRGLAVRELAVTAADLQITGLEHDAPILVADDLLVRPPWVARPAGFHGVELVVPRGAAFGSGEHASTQAALRCLHAQWDSPASVADVGTGSGILALYASVRGCRDLQACDVEAPSVAAARELLPAARISLGGPETLARADCVIANLTAAELHAAMPAVLGCWTRRSALVLGGMRANEVDGVVQRVALLPCHVEVREAFTALAFRAAGQGVR